MLCSFGLLLAVVASTASADKVWHARVDAAVLAYQKERGHVILEEFFKLLRHPGTTSDPQKIASAARYIVGAFGARGVELSELQTGDAPPLLYGEIAGTNPERTIGIYAHYDVVAATTGSWTYPPHEPVLLSDTIREGGKPIALPGPGDAIDSRWRVYARGAGDDLNNIMALLSLIDVMEQEQVRPPVAVKIVLDGEEEIGSPNLEDYRRQFTTRFDDVDLWLFFDGPGHMSGTPLIVPGARGIVSAELTVYGASRPLHSGHYGNWAPVPGQILAGLLASMKDAAGRVQIAGFYDGVAPIDSDERDAIQQLTEYDSLLREQLHLVETEAHPEALAERIMLPSLTVKGLRSGEVGEAATNAIPTEATALLEMRLVPGLDPDEAISLLESHVRDHHFHVVRGDPDTDLRLKYARIAKIVRSSFGYPAYRIPLGHAAVRSMQSALGRIGDEAPLIQPMSGGTLPLGKLAGGRDVPVIAIPTANYDSSQHAADENLRLGNLWYGMRALAAAFSIIPDWAVAKAGGRGDALDPLSATAAFERRCPKDDFTPVHHLPLRKRIEHRC